MTDLLSPVMQRIGATADLYGEHQAALAYKDQAENRHRPEHPKHVAARYMNEIYEEDVDARDTEEWRDVARALRFVFRAISLNAKEARADPGVMASVNDEFHKVTHKLKALGMDRVKEWSLVRQQDPRARRARSHFVTGEKGIDFPKGNPARRFNQEQARC